MFYQFSTVQPGDPVTHTHSFSPIIMLHHKWLDRVPSATLHSRISLLIHSKGNSLHPLTPKSQSIPLPPSAPWQPQVCSPCPWFFFSVVLPELTKLLEFLFSGGSRARGPSVLCLAVKDSAVGKWRASAREPMALCRWCRQEHVPSRTNLWEGDPVPVTHVFKGPLNQGAR